MSKTMPISELKTRLPELISGIAEREEEIVVTRNGKPAAVLVNYDEYERLKDCASWRALWSRARRGFSMCTIRLEGVSDQWQPVAPM